MYRRRLDPGSHYAKVKANTNWILSNIEKLWLMLLTAIMVLQIYRNVLIVKGSYKTI
jgi:hypothetical protein